MGLLSKQNKEILHDFTQDEEVYGIMWSALDNAIYHRLNYKNTHLYTKLKDQLHSSSHRMILPDFILWFNELVRLFEQEYAFTYTLQANMDTMNHSFYDIYVFEHDYANHGIATVRFQCNSPIVELLKSKLTFKEVFVY